jgi:hypothetical protein
MTMPGIVGGRRGVYALTSGSRERTDDGDSSDNVCDRTAVDRAKLAQLGHHRLARFSGAR